MDNFKIIGISIETTNQNGQSLEDLEKLWEKFWGENIQDQIPNKLNNEIYAVYTDCENGDEGEYTVIIGLPLKSLDDIPSDFVGKNQKIVSKGKMPEAVVKTWTEIWQNKTLPMFLFKARSTTTEIMPR